MCCYEIVQVEVEVNIHLLHGESLSYYYVTHNNNNTL